MVCLFWGFFPPPISSNGFFFLTFLLGKNFTEVEMNIFGYFDLALLVEYISDWNTVLLIIMYTHFCSVGLSLILVTGGHASVA